MTLSSDQISAFSQFQHLLLEWNERMNLTSVTETTDVQVKHFLDSLTVLSALPEPVRRGEGGCSLLDVGAGAGFPGIPLAIVRPMLRVTLLEATHKKCRFLEYVVAALHLPGVEVVCGRAEELAHVPSRRGEYDVVVARAVASLATLAELCLPFVRVGGRMIASKTLGISAEVAASSRAIDELGGRMANPINVRLPIVDQERQLIVVDKVRVTPARYPRRPGVPAKTPL